MEVTADSGLLVNNSFLSVSEMNKDTLAYFHSLPEHYNTLLFNPEKQELILRVYVPHDQRNRYYLHTFLGTSYIHKMVKYQTYAANLTEHIPAVAVEEFTRMIVSGDWQSILWAQSLAKHVRHQYSTLIIGRK